MAASRLSAAAASCSTPPPNRMYADSPFRFSPFSSSTPSTPAQAPNADSSRPDSLSAVENSRARFDPELLERGAEALREINSSPHAKQVFEVMGKQEQTRLAELAAEKANFEAIQAHGDITDHEARRRHTELVQMQEELSIRKEQARRATEEQMQLQQRRTDKERAELEPETIRVKAMAEVEGRAHEAKLTEDHNRRLLLEQINGEREKWLAAINITFSHIEDILIASPCYSTAPSIF